MSPESEDLKKAQATLEGIYADWDGLSPGFAQTGAKILEQWANEYEAEKQQGAGAVLKTDDP